MTVGCPILIGDGLKGTDDIEVPAEGGEYIKKKPRLTEQL